MSFYLTLHMYVTTERGLERNVSLEDWEFDSRSFNTRCPKEKLLRKCAQHSKLILQSTHCLVILWISHVKVLLLFLFAKKNNDIAGI